MKVKFKHNRVLDALALFTVLIVKLYFDKLNFGQRKNEHFQNSSAG